MYFSGERKSCSFDCSLPYELLNVECISVRSSPEAFVLLYLNRRLGGLLLLPFLMPHPMMMIIMIMKIRRGLKCEK